MNSVIEQIYTSGSTVTIAGESVPLDFSIDPVEGRFLANIIANDPTVCTTLEVGCAYGLSALHICEATRGRADACHYILDPNESTHYQSAGIHALNRANLTHYVLKEKVSEIGLPEILTELGNESFDLIFVDGWHTFDHTLIDCFYATRLLRVGGYLVIDDCNWPAVAAVVARLRAFPCYELAGELSTPVAGWKKRTAVAMASWLHLPNRVAVLLPAAARRLFRIPNMVCLKKVAKDERPCDWHRN